MAKNDIGGVWRTIGGRRVFIKDGQDLASAMKESGKFKAGNKIQGNKEKNYNEVNIEEENERLEIAKEIAKELNPSLKNASDTLLEKRAGEIMAYSEGEPLSEGEKPHTNRFGEIERSTKSLKEWRDSLRKSSYDNYVKETLNNDEYLQANRPNEYFQKQLKESGVKTFADEIKEQDKYAVAKHEGFGDYNKDNIPVYQNKIDYTGDFGRNADLSTLNNKELQEAIKVQTEELNKAKSEKIGDQRTRNGRMDKIFNTAKVQQYEEGVKLLKEESIRRENEKYPEYEKKGYGVKYYSVEDVAKDPNSKMNQYIRAEKERKAYKKYLKLHPNSEISFEQFKDMNKK